MTLAAVDTPVASCVEYGETGLTFPRELTFDEWQALGATLGRMAESVMFWLGDWWLWGEHHYGEAAAQAARPKRWRRRLRRTLIVTGVAGAAYVVVTKTPLKAKLSELVFGPPLDDDEAEPITLPVTGSPAPGPAAEAEEASGEAEKGEGAAPAKAKRASKGSAPQDDGASA